MIIACAVLTLATAAVLIRPFWCARGVSAAVAICAMLACGGGALYLALGRPGLPDAPFAERVRAPDFALKREAWRLIKQLERDPSAAGFSALGEMMVELAGGRVTPEAGEAFARALEMDGNEPRARFYAGLALYQRGKPAAALAVWRTLEKNSKPDATWLPLLRKKIDEAERTENRPR
jgi:hypothetical protein